MNFKWLAISSLCLATVTACADPMASITARRALARQQTLEATGKISSGACDDVGQLIAKQYRTGGIMEASAAPTQR